VKKTQQPLGEYMMNNNLKISALAVFGLVAASMGSLGADCSRPMTSEMQSMYSMLDDAHKKMMDSMSCEGQDQAMQMMSQSCAGKKFLQRNELLQKC